MKIKALISLLIFAIIVGFFWKGLRMDPHKIPSVLIGKPVPAFKLSSLEKPKQVLTQKIFQGHITLLNIWATWCLSCRTEQPILIDIANTKKITLIGVNYKDKRPAAISWLNKMGNPYSKNLFDASGRFGINLGVYGTPETFIIDQQGIIRYKIIGVLTTKIWKDKILPLTNKLKGKAA